MGSQTVVFLCMVAVSLVSALNLDVAEQFQKRAASSRIAFSAGLTTNADLHHNNTVIFNKVFSNAGNGYNSTTGLFTCPLAGTYVFQFHGLTEADGDIWMELYKNDKYLISAYTHSSNDYGAASNAIVISLKVGDVVRIQSDGDIYLYGAPDEIYGTFNGFLLYAVSGNSGN